MRERDVRDIVYIAKKKMMRTVKSHWVKRKFIIIYVNLVLIPFSKFYSFTIFVLLYVYMLLTKATKNTCLVRTRQCVNDKLSKHVLFKVYALFNYIILHNEHVHFDIFISEISVYPLSSVCSQNPHLIHFILLQWNPQNSATLLWRHVYR